MPLVCLFAVSHILEEVCQCGVCVFYTDHCGPYLCRWLEVLVDQQDAGLARIYVLLVFWIGKETQAAVFSVFYLGKAFGFCVLVSVHCSVKDTG